MAAIAALAFGFLGFSAGETSKLPWTSRLYLSAQLLTLESGTLTDRVAVSGVLEVARWSGVFAALGAVINTLLTLLDNRAYRMIMRLANRHFVIVGAGDAGVSLSSQLADAGESVIVVDNRSIEDGELDNRVMHLQGDARSPAVLRQVSVDRMSAMISLASKDSENISIAEAVLNYRVAGVRSGGWNSSHDPATLYVQTDNFNAFQVNNAVCQKAQIEMRRFSRYQNAARKLFADHPLDGKCINIDSDATPHVVIVGNGTMAESVLRQSLAIGHFANGSDVKITLVDPNANQFLARLKVVVPELQKCGEVETCESSVGEDDLASLLETAGDHTDGFFRVVLCDDAPTSFLQQATLWTEVCRRHGCVLHIDATSEDGLTGLAEFSHVDLFGTIEESCSSEIILDTVQDRMATRIHVDYVKKRLAAGDQVEQFPAIAPWPRLTHETKEMNRQQADHIAVKLRSLGFVAVPASDAKPEWPTDVSEEQIEALAKAEHRRWAASRRLFGWTYGPRRDDTQRQHPDLVTWQELSESTREYDRDPVRQLPRTLSEAGYTITCCDSA